MNYHFNMRKLGYTFAQTVRIANRLAVRTGTPRLLWPNHKGRVHIIAKGEGGYWQEQDEWGQIYLRGNVPPQESVDWTLGDLIECIPVDQMIF